jgi:hypothetical protein
VLFQTVAEAEFPNAEPFCPDAMLPKPTAVESPEASLRTPTAVELPDAVLASPQAMAASLWLQADEALEPFTVCVWA